MRITQRRVGDRIVFFNDAGNEVGVLYDHHNHIIHDQAALDFHAAIMDTAPVDLAAEFARLGLTVTTARAIDAMPAPDMSL